MTTTGRKARATREIFTLIENMRTKETKTRNRTRKASRHWVVTKLRMTSTSEVHRWMISPVWWAVCQAKGSFWIWVNRVSRMPFTKRSEHMAVPVRLKNPNRAARPETASTPAAAQRRAFSKVREDSHWISGAGRS